MSPVMNTVLLHPHAGNLHVVLLAHWVSGGGIRRFVLGPWDMNNVALVPEGLLLEVEELWVGDVLQVPVAQGVWAGGQPPHRGLGVGVAADEGDGGALADLLEEGEADTLF